MNKFLAAVLDTESGLYGEPFVSLHEKQAIARFQYACAVDYDSVLFHECEIFQLHSLGLFDDVTGEILPDLRIIARGVSFAAQRDINREKYYSAKILLQNEETVP